MHNERELKRLNELFSGIEVLAVNPAGRTPQRHPEPGTPPSHGTDPKLSVLGNEANMVEVGAHPAATVQLGQQDSEPLSLYQQAQMRLAYSDARLESPRASTLTLPGISKPISSPLKAGAGTVGGVQIAPRADGQSTDAELGVTDPQALGIGLLAGLILTGFVLAFTLQMDFFNTLGHLAVIVVEVLFGIMGALAAQSSKKNRRAIWAGAVTWALVPVVVAVLFSLIIFSLLLSGFLGA
jgi:hypothetical protein